jgi:exosortase/archaeosortase family protein
LTLKNRLRGALRNSGFRVLSAAVLLPILGYCLFLYGELSLMIPACVLTLGAVAYYWKSKAMARFKGTLVTVVFATLLVWGILAFNVQDMLANSAYGVLFAQSAARFSTEFLSTLGIRATDANGLITFAPGAHLGSILVAPLCSASYSSIAFFAVFSVMLVDLRIAIPLRRLAALFLTGAIALQLLDVFRVSLLVLVGYFYGYDFMEALHLYLGFAIFLGFSGAFWLLALRKPLSPTPR